MIVVVKNVIVTKTLSSDKSQNDVVHAFATTCNRQKKQV